MATQKGKPKTNKDGSIELVSDVDELGPELTDMAMPLGLPTEVVDLNSADRVSFLARLEGKELEESTKPADSIDLIDPIWDRQLEESDEDYKMFITYGNLPPGDRTVVAAWRKWTGEAKAGQPSGTFYWKYKRFRWKERADAWDWQRIHSMRDNWLTRDDKRREADYKMGHLLREIGRIRLEEMSLDEIKNEVNPYTAARFIELAQKLQAEALPDLKLEAKEIKQLLQLLPETKRQNIVTLLISERSLKVS